MTSGPARLVEPESSRRRLEQSLTEALTGGSGDAVTVAGQSRHVIGYMKDFLFRPEQARTPVGVLSGGKRARLTLARAFARPSNLLVLTSRPTISISIVGPRRNQGTSSGCRKNATPRASSPSRMTSIG
jgi:hypothetical protein